MDTGSLLEKDRSNSQPLQSFRVPIRLSFHISMTYWL